MCQYWDWATSRKHAFSTEIIYPCFRDSDPDTLNQHWIAQLTSFYDRGADAVFLYSDPSNSNTHGWVTEPLNWNTSYGALRDALTYYSGKPLQSVTHLRAIHLSCEQAHIVGNEAHAVNSPVVRPDDCDDDLINHQAAYLDSVSWQPGYLYDKGYDENCDIITNFILENSPSYIQDTYTEFWFTATSRYIPENAYLNLLRNDVTLPMDNATWDTSAWGGRTVTPGLKTKYNDLRSPTHLVWRSLARQNSTSAELVTRVTNAYPTYSPDGKRVAYMSNADGDFDIYVRYLDERIVRKLTDAPDQDGTPVWSPGGSQIAFRSMRDGRSQIYLMNADGSNQRNISTTESNDEHPFWSADGRKILFCSDRTTIQAEKEKNYDIFEMNSDGSHVRQITRTPEVETYPSWSPDGSRIVCRKIMENGEWEVVVMNADGSEATNISNHNGFDGWPVWSPDGSMIAYSSEVDGTMRIFVMDLDGSRKRQVTNDGRWTEDRQPSWHPNGTFLLFSRYEWFKGETWYEASRIYAIRVSQ
jgi:TolB protein